MWFDFLKEHVKVVKSGDSPVHLETMEPGAVYCVKARALVKAIGRHSAFSQTQCVEMQGKDNQPVPGSPHLAALPMVPGLSLALHICFQVWWVLR